MACDLVPQHFGHVEVNRDSRVCVTISYRSSEVSHIFCTQKSNCTLHFEITQEFLMHSIKADSFPFRQ